MLRSISATLIALAAFVLPVQAGTISILGIFAGIEITNLTLVGSNYVGTQTGSGTGDLIPLGAYTWTISDDVTIPGPSVTTFTTTNGTFTDTFSGGTLFGTFTGSGTDPTNAVIGIGTFVDVITGGTGAYLGDTGTLTIYGTLVNATGATFGSESGSLTTTPLPSTWLMLLGGLVGLGFFVYRGPKKNAAALAAA
jgi:hypothetical protein